MTWDLENLLRVVRGKGCLASASVHMATPSAVHEDQTLRGSSQWGPEEAAARSSYPVIKISLLLSFLCDLLTSESSLPKLYYQESAPQQPPEN